MASYSYADPVVARRLLAQRFAAVSVCLLAAFAALSSAETSAAEKKSEKIVADFFAERMLFPHTIDKVWPAAPSRGAMLNRGQEWETIENEGELIRVRVTATPEREGKLKTNANRPQPMKFDLTFLVADGEVIIHGDTAAFRLANESLPAWKRRTTGQVPRDCKDSGHLPLKPTEEQLETYIAHLRDTEPWLNAQERYEKALRLYYGQRDFWAWMRDIADGRYIDK